MDNNNNKIINFQHKKQKVMNNKNKIKIKNK